MIRLFLPIIILAVVLGLGWLLFTQVPALLSAATHRAELRRDAHRRHLERRRVERATRSLLATREASVATLIGTLLRNPAVDRIDKAIMADLIRLGDEMAAAARECDQNPTPETLGAYSSAVRAAEHHAEVARVQVARAELLGPDEPS